MVDRHVGCWPNPGTLVGYALLLVGLLALAACAPGARYHRFGGQTMGTDYVVTLCGGNTCNPTLSQAAEAELQRVNTQMSTWQPGSEISRFNAAPAGEWLAISEEVAEIVFLSQKLARLSEGAFDITVGPLVDLWGFGSVAQRAVPTEAAIAVAASRVGHGGLQARRNPPALRKRVEGLRLDLSAIAKGHAVDRLAALLDNAGCTDYLIDIGGEVRVRGTNPKGEAWRVGIEAPTKDGATLARRMKPIDPARWLGTGTRLGEPDRDIVRILRLTDVAVATSGDYRNLRRIGEATFSHTIDPRTGRPLAHRMASVTVIAETAALADGLATLINVLGPDNGLDFANRTGVAALALVRGDERFEERYTEAMREYVE